MKTIALCCWLLFAGTPLCLAQTLSTNASASLYSALGEQAGIDRLVDDFVERVIHDPRIGSHFKGIKPAGFKESLAEQFCVVSGGPCTSLGSSMREVHADMKINKGDFNALVEQLQHAMEAQGIPFSLQNRLLARLAPLHRDIITVH